MTICQIGVIFEGRCQPVGGALEHQHLFRLLGDDGNELRGACTRADHCDALAREIDVVIPLGRVKRRPGERGATGNVGQLRSVQLARCIDDCIERVGVGATLPVDGVDLPRCRAVVELHGLHRGRELDHPAHAELVREAPEVVEQRGLSREVLRPVVALGERVAEQVAGDIDPAARVGVLQPGAADLRVLLVDDSVDTGLSQPVRRQQARHAGSDHGDTKRSIRGEVGGSPRWCAKVLSRAAELLEQQRQVVVARLPCHHPGDDRPHRFGGGLRRLRPTGVTKLVERPQGDAAGEGLLIGGPAALWLVMFGRVEEQIVARQIRCRGDVRERCEQRGKICHRHHLGELLVGARELDRL